MLGLVAGLLILVLSTVHSTEAAGAVSGRVLLRGENTPVARARVTLVAIRRGPPPANSEPSGPPPQMLTGSNGDYAFDRVAPGEYRVNVQKAGLAEGAGAMQQMSVIVAPGQAARVADIFLDRAGAIAGRIFDADGEPLADARVSALHPAPNPPALAARGIRPPANRPLIPAGHTAQTNDLGEFRIYGLLPGDYIVGATAQSNPFLVASTSATTLSTTYFPGVTDQGAAQPVSVAAGQTTNDVEIRMTTAAAYLVSGVVVDAAGQPLEGAMVSINSATTGSLGPHGLSRSDARGRFRINSVTNGTYRIGVAGSSSGPGATMRLPQQVTITVADSNVTGLQLVLVPKQ